MKLNIYAAAMGDAIASVAGNIVAECGQQFEFDFAEGEFAYLFVADSKGRCKGQSVGEFALEHLRDGFSMGDLKRESIVDDFSDQCRYLNAEINGVGEHLKDIANHGCHLNGFIGVNDEAMVAAVGEGAVFLFRDDTLYRISEPTAPLGYGREEEDSVMWQTNEPLQEGDKLLIVSGGILERLDDEQLEDEMAMSKLPTQTIMDLFLSEGPIAPAAVIAAKVGGGEFIEIDEDEEYEEGDGRYDAWV